MKRPVASMWQAFLFSLTTLHGQKNVVSTFQGFIGAGDNNRVVAGAANSSIAGGSNNRVCAQNTFIGGGLNNNITPTSPCSAILGGSGNVATHAWAGIFGQGLASVAARTFHVNCLNAVDTPAVTGGMPPGTIMWRAGNAILPTDRVLVIA